VPAWLSVRAPQRHNKSDACLTYSTTLEDVDYVQPVEAVVPGVRGRVLGVLARVETELTIRTVSRLAGASVQQTATVIAELVSLGMVTRRDAGSSALVGLERENAAVGAVLALAQVGERVLERLRDSARDIEPQPASLIVFGSFARGDARLTSDLDVLAVRPIGLSPDDATWLDSLGQWESIARRIVGNPLHMFVVSQEEVQALMRRRSGPWRAIAAEGITLVGSSLSSRASVAS